MAAGKLDIVIEQGTTFELALDVYDDEGLAFDLTGWTPSMKIVHKATGAITTVSSMSATGNTITVSIPATTTDDYESESDAYVPRTTNIRNTKYAHVINIVQGTTIKPIVRGEVLVVRGIV